MIHKLKFNYFLQINQFIDKQHLIPRGKLIYDSRPAKYSAGIRDVF